MPELCFFQASAGICSTVMAIHGGKIFEEAVCISVARSRLCSDAPAGACSDVVRIDGVCSGRLSGPFVDALLFWYQLVRRRLEY